MKPVNEPREWWLNWQDRSEADKDHRYFVQASNVCWPVRKDDSDGCIRVIEKSAYDRLNLEVERLRIELMNRNQYMINQEYLDNIHTHYEKELRIARAEIKHLENGFNASITLLEKEGKEIERLKTELKINNENELRLQSSRDIQHDTIIGLRAQIVKLKHKLGSAYNQVDNIAVGKINQLQLLTEMHKNLLVKLCDTCEHFADNKKFQHLPPISWVHVEKVIEEIRKVLEGK